VNNGCDLLVVGLGAMGSAVALQATRLGLSVIGLDRHCPPHEFGSSHAETRITRLAVGEGDEYVPFVARSHQLWLEFEAAISAPLFHQSGGFIASTPGSGGNRWNDFTAATAAVADRHHIAFERMAPTAARAASPRVRFPDSMAVGFEPTAGVVRCEDAVGAQLQLARRAGADLRTDTEVLGLRPRKDHVEVHTAAGFLKADQVVLAAGAWMPTLTTPSVADRLTVTRQVVYWFEVDDLEAFRPERFPFVMWIDNAIEEYSGMFPAPVGSTPGLKVLGEQFHTVTTADSVSRTVTTKETADFHQRLVATRVDGVTARCIRAQVCLYTTTSDDTFLIERDARSDRIVVMSPCSGHGFKHSAALGEAVAQTVATGRSTLSLTSFGLAV